MGKAGLSILAVALSALVGACAAGAAPPSPAPAGLGPTRADTGHALAQRLCARCHQVEREGASPNASSPPFSVLADRYDEVTLGKKLDDIATGHYDMPPTRVSNDEVDSLVAYLESFRDPWAPPRR
jgi:mono/diheme cytochrome c family protein